MDVVHPEDLVHDLLLLAALLRLLRRSARPRRVVLGGAPLLRELGPLLLLPVLGGELLRGNGHVIARDQAPVHLPRLGRGIDLEGLRLDLLDPAVAVEALLDALLGERVLLEQGVVAPDVPAHLVEKRAGLGQGARVAIVGQKSRARARDENRKRRAEEEPGHQSRKPRRTP
jgi:hypothetical protein